MEGTLRRELVNELTPWENQQVTMVKKWFETAAEMEIEEFNKSFFTFFRPLVNKHQVLVFSKNTERKSWLEERIEIHGTYSYRVIYALTEILQFNGYEMNASFPKGSEYAYCIRFSRNRLPIVDEH